MSAGEYFDHVNDNLRINSVSGINQGGKHWDNVKFKGASKYKPRGTVFDRIQSIQYASFYADFKKSTDAIINSFKD